MSNSSGTKRRRRRPRQEQRLGTGFESGLGGLSRYGWGSWLSSGNVAYCSSHEDNVEYGQDNDRASTLNRRSTSRIQRRASKRYVLKPPSVHVAIAQQHEIDKYNIEERGKQQGKQGTILEEERRESSGKSNLGRQSPAPQSTFETLQHGAWAGGVAGVIADTVIHPFDTISMRLKCQIVKPGEQPKYRGLTGTAQVLLREEGFRSLFNGVSATVLCAVPSSAIYFGTYEVVKSLGK